MPHMDLETFVAETLKQIIRGITDVQNEGVHVNLQKVQPVDFDVAVMVNEGADKKGGAGLFVAGLGLGGQVAASSSNSSVSRIKFTVPLAYQAAGVKR